MQSDRLQRICDQSEMEIVAIGASEGGIEALWRIVQELPGDFPAPILVVQHLSPHYGSMLDLVLESRCALRVKFATDGEPLQGGTVYLAPPNRHFTVGARGFAKLTDAERVNWVRPSVDVLFQSVAEHYGTGALAVVLTGNLYDGAAGAVSVKQAGGWVLAQDEDSSTRFDMPKSAIERGAVDYILPLESLSFAIISLIMAFGATSLFRVPSKLSTVTAA